MPPSRQGLLWPDRAPPPHLDADALEAGFATLAPPPRGRGTVVQVVLRDADGRRILPRRIRLTRKEGAVGDRWSRGLLPNTEAQVTVMRADVARLFAQDGDIARFGDNLFVDLDLSEDAIRPGDVVEVGSAVCVVTPKPHRGCTKFEARAGADALAMTRERGRLRLRGLHLRVLEDGDVAEGDAIVVRPPGR